MSHERTAKQPMDALRSRERPRGRPRTRWRNHLKIWSGLRILPVELPLAAGDRDAWRSQFELLPRQTQKDKRAKKDALNYFNVFPENNDDDDLFFSLPHLILSNFSISNVK